MKILKEKCLKEIQSSKFFNSIQRLYFASLNLNKNQVQWLIKSFNKEINTRLSMKLQTRLHYTSFKSYFQ